MHAGLALKDAPRYLPKRPSRPEDGEGYLTGKAGRKPIGTVAREAVQMAEDARIITVKRSTRSGWPTSARLGRIVRL